MYNIIIVIVLVVHITYIQGQTYSLSGSAPYGIRGGDYSFTCQISGGNLLSSDAIQFKQDSISICRHILTCVPGSSTDTRLTCGCINGNNSTLYLNITNIQSTDARNWTCGDAFSIDISPSVALPVYYPPTITSLISNATNNMIDEDSTVTFTCSVDSLPSSVISWYRSQQGEQLYSGSQYTISKASCQHTDNYTCTASNNIGQPVSKTIPLYVRCSPRENMVTTRSITNRVDATINLEVDIIAYPEPNFTWYHTPTRQIINTAITQQLSTINYKSTVEITLNSTLFGDYIVSVDNGVGMQNFTITVIDGEPPKPPEKLGSNNIPTIVGSIIGVLVIVIVVVIGVVIYRRKASRGDDNTYDGLGVTSLSTNQPVYGRINSSTTRSNDTTIRADSTPAYYNTANMNHSDTTNPQYVNSTTSSSTYDGLNGPAHYNTTNLDHSDSTNPRYVNSPSSTYDGLDGCTDCGTTSRHLSTQYVNNTI